VFAGRSTGAWYLLLGCWAAAAAAHLDRFTGFLILLGVSSRRSPDHDRRVLVSSVGPELDSSRRPASCADRAHLVPATLVICWRRADRGLLDWACRASTRCSPLPALRRAGRLGWIRGFGTSHTRTTSRPPRRRAGLTAVMTGSAPGKFTDQVGRDMRIGIDVVGPTPTRS